MNSIPFIDLNAQYKVMKAEIDAAVSSVISEGCFILGPEVSELEERLSEWTGARYCVGVGSGTDALLIALMALDVGPGDEVITSAFSFFASAEVIALTGATPVFADIDPATGNINPDELDRKITPETRAIMPVSLYGQPAEMGQVNEIAKRHGNLPVIEDAAQSFGSTQNGSYSCNLSTIGCTSFFPSKPLGCFGDGGALFTSDEGLAQRFRELRAHGQSRRYHHERVGLCSRLDTIQAAVLLTKLCHFDRERQLRAAIGSRYNEAFDNAGIRRIQQLECNESVFAQYTLLVENRTKVRAQLDTHRIPTAVHYPLPLPAQPPFKGHCCDDCIPGALSLAETVLSIPMHPYLERLDQDRIIEEVFKATA